MQLRFLLNKESRQKQSNLGPVYIRLVSTVSRVTRFTRAGSAQASFTQLNVRCAYVRRMAGPLARDKISASGPAHLLFSFNFL